ncbi:hypothetical protein DFH09DRAFT_1316877 [Mycena vulgaris]|nr:hypothetical protein DFH09DRAFT_1316877 [Mycena vulgaris]
MATTSYTIYSHYDPAQRERLERETGQIPSDPSDIASAEAWEAKATLALKRKLAPPPRFVPAARDSVPPAPLTVQHPTASDVAGCVFDMFCAHLGLYTDFELQIPRKQMSLRTVSGSEQTVSPYPFEGRLLSPRPQLDRLPTMGLNVLRIRSAWTRFSNVSISSSAQIHGDAVGTPITRPGTLLRLGDLVVELFNEFKHKHKQRRFISGADISLDVDTALSQEIQEHLKAHSCATSWGSTPPTFRHYMDSLGDDSDRVVHAALLDSVDLFHTGFAGWAGDLAIMLGALPTPICVVPADFLSIPTIEAIMVELSTKLIPRHTSPPYWIPHSLASFHSLPARL